MNQVFKIFLVFSIFYIIYTHFTKDKIQTSNQLEPLLSESPESPELSELPELSDTKQLESDILPIVEINILEDAKYSTEREIIIDENDELFYQAHIQEFYENGFDGYGIMDIDANKDGYSGIDYQNNNTGFSTFDKNELGYFGKDQQNVHNSLIQHTIKNKYLALDKKDDKKDVETEIIKYAKDLNKDYKKIKDIVNQIKRRNSFVKNLNQTETDVLNNSWRSANNNVKCQILNELLDMTDGKSYIVCPTGVTSRIINSDIVNDPESGPLRESDLRKEMLSSASKIRSILEKDPNFECLSQDEQTDIFKRKLIKKYNKDYHGIISEDRIKTELESWINDIF